MKKLILLLSIMFSITTFSFAVNQTNPIKINRKHSKKKTVHKTMKNNKSYFNKKRKKMNKKMRKDFKKYAYKI